MVEFTGVDNTRAMCASAGVAYWSGLGARC